MTAISSLLQTSWSGDVTSSGQKGIRITRRAVEIPRAACVYQLGEWESFLLRQAAKLAPSTWYSFRTFLADLESSGLEGPTSAAASDDGAIAMYWRHGSDHFEIEFEPDGRWSWFATSLADDRSELQSGIGIPSITPELRDNLRLASGKSHRALPDQSEISIEA